LGSFAGVTDRNGIVDRFPLAGHIRESLRHN
jgi:hypothetical protein